MRYFVFKSFRGGVHPHICIPGFKPCLFGKDLVRSPQIAKAKVPKEVIIPLLQHVGSPCEPIVKVGDRVKCGELIGRDYAFVSSPIHSSVEGVVKGIENIIHPVLGRVKVFVIETSNPDALIAPFTNKTYKRGMTAEELRNLIHDAGIVGLGGAAFPTHVKLNPPKNKKLDSIILNGAECEPYLSCDNALMIEKTTQIIKGFEILKVITGAENLYIAIEDNKKDALLKIEKAVEEVNFKIEVVKLKSKYPQGGEKQLIKAVLNREVPSGGLPFDIGVLVQNVGTVNAIYEAVFEGKPLIERLVTITGKIVNKPQNLVARIGTKLKDLIEECGGLKGEVGKIIFGGPMMGIASFSLDVPIIKGTSGILVLGKDEIKEDEERICIRCGKCVEACPVGITPTTIALAAASGKYGISKDFGALDCIECGACSYVCPTKRHLLPNIKLAKFKIRELSL